MGYRSTWIAVYKQPLDTVLETMGFERTGERDELSEPGFNAVEMPEWSILIADGSDYYTELGEAEAATLSRGGRSLLFTCSDTVMCTQLVEYANGNEVWRIDYEGINGVSEAEVTGNAPPLVHEHLAERGRSSSRRAITSTTSMTRRRRWGSR